MAYGSFTNAGSSSILTYLFQGVDLPAPACYAGVAKSASSKTAFGTELTGGGYTRIQTDATYWQVPTVGVTNLLKDIIFPRSTGYEGETYSVGLFSEATGGVPFAYYECTDREMVKTDDAFVILSGGMSHQFVAGSQFSLWLQNAILNHFYRGVPLELGDTAMEFGYSTTTPTATTPGTEPAGNGYARKTRTRNNTNFAASGATEMQWVTDLQFDVAAGTQGNVIGLNYYCNAQYLLWGTCPSTAIALNDAFLVAAGTSIKLDA